MRSDSSTGNSEAGLYISCSTHNYKPFPVTVGLKSKKYIYYYYFLMKVRELGTVRINF